MDAVTTHECCAVSSKPGSIPDLVVIGAGSAGFSAAIRASELGARVALIGAGTIGGTCVNIGCVPSKTLIRAAEALHHGTAAPRFAGIAARAGLTDWAALMAQKDALVTGLREAKYAALLPEYEGIRSIEGAARFTADGLIVGDARFPAERVVIATGASPAIPPIPGIGDVAYLTSTTALALDRLPRALLVIGGGVIGCELGQMFARFG
ncbi:MAG: FAD-dependent oxidoreductase, partial [Rhodospirillales bacterium]|nr:FAD-dependent oxidoreductase [Rhodospirillales bacterium]